METGAQSEIKADSGDFYPRLLSWLAGLFDAETGPQPASAPPESVESAPIGADGDMVIGDGASLIAAIAKFLGLANDAPAIPDGGDILRPAQETIEGGAIESRPPPPLNPPDEQEY